MTHWVRVMTMAATLSLGLFPMQVWAGVVLSGTRVIFNAGEREVGLNLKNQDESPSLVQTWVDAGDASAAPEKIHTPFLITPPITRLEPNQQLALRIIFTGEELPKDRESVFFINVLDIPARPKVQEGDSLVQVAFRTRIKLFYRPLNLSGSPIKAVDELSWRISSTPTGLVVHVRNPAAYSVSFNQVAVKVDGKVYNNANGGMVAPFSTQDFPIDNVKANSLAGASVVFNWVGDYGEDTQKEARNDTSN
ncbi:fimbrial biogenesis chaperone [Pseudomonas vancouverensis]|uniref:Uncharacterized protein n=1 Tax=Pseudomonas vancouverensis TaxID=95300 RepID=A0A1H2N2U2_PSEVA|nr:fimbria/pilus periplasmic chaperone [Pseudomonas vancouverensis]KAB0495811.1 fimbria/pilus periplasmic chaperone [Pseudomonas vancouverensis]TDB65613.1 hypothetical protein EIY72_08875 [Pseudomonas vancouverensis]SDU99839.1 chaperone protein EcpD [Pseudomonas vancouverensis]